MNDLRAEIFVSVCSVVEENERLKEEIACLKYRVKALEDALRLISSGRGLVKDKSTVYMNGSSPVVQKHFNTRDMIEIASKALEAECK